MTDVLVVGGGAAGLLAALAAARNGASVLLLEPNSLLGRKIRITGKGRCNLTNDCGVDEFLQHIPTNPKFLYSALNAFSPQDTKELLESLGVPLKTERGRRVFPVSDRACDIADALADGCRAAGAAVRRGRASAVLQKEGRAAGVLCDGEEIPARAVILATGGKSYPLTGSDGNGYRLAAGCGHRITEIRPSLVPLSSRDESCADMQGLSLRNVELTLWDKSRQKAVFRELGEMLFTHYGMSGPLVLSASAHIRPFEEGRWEVSVDLKPGLDEKQLDARILRDFGEFINRDFANSLEKLLPRKLIPVAALRSGIPPLTKVNAVTREERRSLAALLKGMRFSVDGFRPIEEAIVTAGGVDVNEVSPKTMESKLLPGLYFAGELLDVDGYTGGFNLQIAFSTGFAAGQSAAWGIGS